MNGGRIFKDHPGWFGKDKNGRPSEAENVVFNTDNPEAVRFFNENFLSYISSHPEIDVFDLWPPDVARWNLVEKVDYLKPPALQAAFLEKVRKALAESGSAVRLETIAFAKTLEPAALNRDIMVDICPINQNFEKQIFDTLSAENRIYASAIRRWRENFGGDIGIYTYYRKYAWKSLPNIIPHYMQADLIWYAKLPLQGISCYAEPGDWFTYELNHFILGKLEWDPWTNVDSLITVFCRGRYDTGWEQARTAYSLLEQTVRFFGNIRNSSLKPANGIREAEKRTGIVEEELRKAQSDANPEASANFSGLMLMLRYAQLDFRIQAAKAEKAPEDRMIKLLDDLRTFQSHHRDEGILIYDEKEDISYLEKHYEI